MKIWNEREYRVRAAAAALAVLCAVALPQRARAEGIRVPAVPDGIGVDAGNEAFLVGHAVGTQNYVCLPSGSGFGFALFTPEATLSDDDGSQLTTHFFSPNPDEKNTNPAVVADGAVRPTWQHSRDTSAVWGKVATADASSTDPRFVARNAIPWLKVTATGWETGPDGGDILADTTFIQRLNTSGGVAPSTGCASPADVGRLAFIPYTADYFFYRASHGG